MARSSQDKLLESVGRIYEATLSPQAWDGVVASIADYLCVNGVFLFWEDFKARTAPFAILSGYDPSEIPSYTEHYMHLDPSIEWLLARPEGSVVSTSLHIPSDQWRHSEIFNDFAQPLGYWHSAGTFFVMSDRGAAGLGVQRADRDHGFDMDDVRRLTTLIPHLRRAFVLTGRLQGADSERERLLSLLDKSAGAVVLLDRAGRVSLCSPKAQRILTEHKGLSVVNGRLVASHRPSQSRLEALIHDAIQTGLGRGIGAAGAMQIPDPVGNATLRVLVSPMAGLKFENEVELRNVAAVVLMQEPDASAAPDPAMLAPLFGLTPAEARLAAALADGSDLYEIADQFQISRHTARTQLKSAMGKMGARRQAELVRLVLNSPARIRR